jgi:hypothetical protein
VESGFDAGSGRDVPDWDDPERERDEDAAWRDLVARFDAPLTAQESVPWPAREDMSRRAPGSQEAPEAGGASGTHGADGADGTGGERAGRAADSRRATDGWYGGPEGFGTDGILGGFDADGTPGAQDQDTIEAPRRIRGPGAGRIPRPGTSAPVTPDGKATPDSGAAPDGEAAVLGSLADDEGEHFIPPAPPPLPKLDPMAKGAWAALFGGPGYLVVATAAGWSVSGFAAFCAVAAFVAGFAILVLRMNEPEPKAPGGPDDGDDGAVV